MLHFPTSTKNDAKCSVTHGTMGHINPNEPPLKRKPFAAILNHGFVQRVELVLPAELFEIISKDVLRENKQPVYSRVILPLKDILEGRFFNEYIKKGNIMMLSEGIVGVDNVYSLREGILTLHLDKESYERAGLVGKPHGVKGKRGTKPWWVVEINLRLPSMLHGKKGFDRIVYSFKNVLTTPVTWLFHDLGKIALSPDPLDLHFPDKKSVSLETSRDIKVNMPSLKPPTEIDAFYGADFDDYALETHEWISMVLLESPRINSDDKIDPFLSRYIVPGVSTEQKLVKFTWQGFVSSCWAHKLFTQVLVAIPRDAWVAYSVVGVAEGLSESAKNCTILKVPDAPTEYVLWEIA